jgi:hypothetical protein
VGPALVAARKPDAEPAKPLASAEAFAGLYASAWGETIVVPWEGGLAALDVPTNDPAGDLVKLAHVDGNVFRRVRDDGDDRGEEVVFEADDAGEVTRVRWHQNYARKVR